MTYKTTTFIFLCVLLSIFFISPAYPQGGFQQFKKEQTGAEKIEEGFGKFKKELEEEYRVWLKDEKAWKKITLEYEPPEASELIPAPSGEDIKKRGKSLRESTRSHTRPDMIPLPEKTFRVSSGFGYRTHPIHKRRVFHAGIDYAAGRGTRIVASADGNILKAGVAGGYGNYILIKHAKRYKTAYAHLDRVIVRKNQKVRRGELIGFVGSSGRSTGPHLHYEVVLGNKKIDPATLIVK